MKKLCFLIILASVINICSAQTAQEADSLHIAGRDSLAAGNYVAGRALTKRAMDIRKAVYGEVSEKYVNSLNNYAMSFFVAQEYDKALELQKQVIDLSDKLSAPIAGADMNLLNLARCYYYCGNIEEAAKSCERALSVSEKFSDTYGSILDFLANAYMERSDMKNVYRIMGLMEEHNQNELSKPCDEPDCMFERAQYFAAIGDNTQAKETFLKLLVMPMDDDMKIKVYREYAKTLGLTKEYATAGSYYLAAAKMYEKKNGRDETYVQYVYWAAIYTYIGKQYSEAIPLYNEVIELTSGNAAPEMHKKHIASWRELGHVYSAMRESEKAKECYSKVLSLYDDSDKNNEKYAEDLIRIANIERRGKNYEAAMGYYETAVKIFEENKIYSSEYSTAVSNLNLCYTVLGLDKVATDEDKADALVKAEEYRKLDEIITSEKEALPITEAYLGKMTYAGSLAVIAGCHAMKEEYPAAVEYYKPYIENLRIGVREMFRYQNENERALVWEKEKNNLSEIGELLFVLPEGDSLVNDVAAMLYDEALLSKGILLNSAIEFENVILEYAGEDTKKLYEQTKANDVKINRLRMNAATDADMERLLQLMQENKELELALYKECAEYADFTDYISYNWKDVQAAMTEEDIAIEFVGVEPGVLNDEKFIIALLLAKGMETPLAVPVCNYATAQIMANDSTVFSGSKNLLWGLFHDIIKDKKRIYFSADKAFNHIAIEYFAYNGKPLSEQYEVFRLSTTKELCYKKKKKTLDNVVLFGDINYNVRGMQSAETLNLFAAMRGALGEDGFGNLGNTKREIEEIKKVMEQYGINNVVKLADDVATKEALIELDGSKVNILHIATHGISVNSGKMSDDESMKNCVLAFAGANADDNALVTAAEVAKLNLRECDLAVLSACETGLGKLGDDGVYGLQRGFKNAGVNSLLMSLKKVHDASTAEMMILFYKNMMSGNSKREALVNAQKEMRNRGYDAPEHWTPFILLDALD